MKRHEALGTQGLLLLVLTVAIPLGTQASPLGDARKEVAIEKNKYFDTIYANPTMSSADMAKLYNQLVVPAESKVPSAFSQTIRDQWLQIKEDLQKENEAAQAVIRKRAKATGEKTPVGKFGKKSTPSNIDTGPSKPEVVLDGSGIAKEIEFKGKARRVTTAKKSATHAPTVRATPVAPPTIIDYHRSTATPGTGGVDEMEFGAKPAPSPKVPSKH